MELRLRAAGCHLPYGITQCYLPADTSEHPALTTARHTGTRFIYPGWIEGWVDVAVSYRDILPTNRLSTFQVLTQQRTAGRLTANPLITSPTP